MKLTVKQYTDFYAQFENHLKDGNLYVEGETIKIDGEEVDGLDPTDYTPDKVIEVVDVGGYFVSNSDETEHLDGKTFANLYRKWLKKQGLKHFSVSVPIEKVEAFKDALKKIGIKS